MRVNLHWLIAILLLLNISACGENGSTASQTDSQTSVTLVADKTQVVADGTDGVTLTATVKDAAGTPMAHQVVSFAVPLSFTNFPSPVRFTDENGQFVLFLRPSLLLQLGIPAISTQDDITVTSLGVTSSPVTITINPRPVPTTSSVTLVADKTQAIADGRDTVTFTATVKDENGTPIPRQAISFIVPPGTNIFMSPTRTDANGLAVIRLSCLPNSQNASKVFDVTATSGGVTSNTVTVTYSAPPQVAPAVVTLAADKTTLLANVIDRVTFTISATDSSGSPLAGQRFNLNVPTGPYLWAVQIMTNTAGQASALLQYRTSQIVVTSPTVISVTATINGTTSNAISITVNPP